MDDPSSRPLDNLKHERFAQLMAAGASIEDAFRQAGYSYDKGNARKLKAACRDRIDYLRQQSAEKVTTTIAARTVEIAHPIEQAHQIAATKEFVTSALLDHALICMGQKKVLVSVLNKTTNKMEEVEAYARHAPAANRALELLGKECGMFNEKVVSPEERAKAAPIKTMEDDAAVEMLEAYRARREARRAAQNG